MVFNHVQSGQPLNIRASDWNGAMDAARTHMQQAGRGSRTGPAENPSNTVILVKNNSGADVGRFAVLGIDVPIISPGDNENEFARQVTLSCVAPVAGTHDQKFVITQEPIRSGGIGRAAIAGVTVAKVALANTADTTAGIVDADASHLAGGVAGVQILWAAGTAGGAADWAVVRLGVESRSTFLAQITGNASLATNRWKYAWVEVELDGNSIANVTGGRSGTASDG